MLHHMLQRDLEFVCATPEAIQAAYRKYYGTADEAADELALSLGGVDLESDPLDDLVTVVHLPMAGRVRREQRHGQLGKANQSPVTHEA